MNFITTSIAAISLLASVHFGGANIKSMTENNPVYVVEPIVLVEKVQPQPIATNSAVESAVKDYFKDAPIMAKIAQCESRFRQVDANGDVLRGEVNQFDVGVMQINEKYHLDRSEKMGVDIHSLNGNLEYARALYNESGSAPWSSSKPCWSNL